MRKPDQRVVLLALGAVAAIALILGMILKSDPGDDENGTGATTAREATPKGPGESGDAVAGTTTTPKKKAAPKVPTIVVREGEPVGGVAELTHKEGERVRFRVTSDIAEEIHLHGYDIGKEVEAGGSVTFDFTADLEGVFEVELEERATQIAELTVEP